MGRFFLFFLICLFSFGLEAKQVIEFPEDELPRESVLPTFQDELMIKNRRVPLARRFQMDAGLTIFPKEPFYPCCEEVSYHASLGYHLNETHGFSMRAIFLKQGLGKYGRALSSEEYRGSVDFDPEHAPQPKQIFTIQYEPTIYYGKISLLKNFVMNLSLYGLFGSGVVYYGEKEMFPHFIMGLGKKFYFTKNFGLRFDLTYWSYRGPNLTNLKEGGWLDEDKNLGDFDLDWFLFQQMKVNLGVLFVF